MLGNHYIDHCHYQENILPRLNLEDGHQVKIIASTETYVDNLNLGYTEPPRTYMNEDGIEVTRVPYRTFIIPKIMQKIRTYLGVSPLIEAFAPDVILFHGIQAYELLTVARYKKRHPHIRLYADNHGDAHNSALSFIAKWVLHRFFYRAFLKRAQSHIDKVLCISLEAMDFVHDNYGLPLNSLEFYPLGGIILGDAQRMELRTKRRTELQVADDHILFLHSGKMDSGKRTHPLLKAFSTIKDPRFRLLVIGSMSPDVEAACMPLIHQDPRIVYLGWKKASELQEYLCACDMYVQPGGQSATMQNALCAFLPVMLYPHKSHQPFLKGNGFFVKDTEDMIACFSRISENPSLLEEMKQQSRQIAQEILDYRRLAARLYR